MVFILRAIKIISDDDEKSVTHITAFPHAFKRSGMMLFLPNVNTA